MSDTPTSRSWKLIRSLEIALIVGALAGLAFVGLTYSNFLLDMELRQAVFWGIGIGVVLTLLLTYILDQVSLAIGGFRTAVKGRGNKSSTQKKAK
jgi:hypothetical protein